MRIIYKLGNVVDCAETYITHGCNCQGKMSKGVALDIKNKYPQAFYDYILALQKGGLVLGDVIIVNVGTIIEPKVIFNCLTQFTYNKNPDIKNVDYDAIRNCIMKINLYFIEHGFADVAMSKIGASLGGGNWTIISKIIEEESTHFQPIVYELKES